jgi:hypothetical protein
MHGAESVAFNFPWIDENDLFVYVSVFMFRNDIMDIKDRVSSGTPVLVNVAWGLDIFANSHLLSLSLSLSLSDI